MDAEVSTDRLHWWMVDYFPAGLFGSVMGLTGLSVAWQFAHQIYGVPLWPSSAISVIAIVVFLCVGATYTLKLVIMPRSVAAELSHPVAGSLFGTLFISMLLLPLDVEPYSLLLAQVIWWAGATGMIAFAGVVV